jgi:hypothetical protein
VGAAPRMGVRRCEVLCDALVLNASQISTKSALVAVTRNPSEAHGVRLGSHPGHATAFVAALMEKGCPSYPPD